MEEITIVLGFIHTPEYNSMPLISYGLGGRSKPCVVSF